MRGLAILIMRGRMQAAMVVSVCAVLSLVLSPLGYLAAAGIALVTLRHGAMQGLVLSLAAGLAAGLLSLAVGRHYLEVTTLVFSQWLPVWLVAIVLRAWGSQQLALLSAGAMGIAAVAAMYVVLDSPRQWWLVLLEQLFLPLMNEQGVALGPDVLPQAAAIMTGVVAAGGVLGVMLAVYIGRWWQADLYNPGGFGKEFRDLRLGRRMALATVLVGLMATLGSAGIAALAIDWLVVLAALFLIQGLATAHGMVKRAGASVGWLVGLYVLLFLWMPYGLLAVAGFGFLDNWLDPRARLDAGRG